MLDNKCWSWKTLSYELIYYAKADSTPKVMSLVSDRKIDEQKARRYLHCMQLPQVWSSTSLWFSKSARIFELEPGVSAQHTKTCVPRPPPKIKERERYRNDRSQTKFLSTSYFRLEIIHPLHFAPPFIRDWLHFIPIQKSVYTIKWTNNDDE